MKRKVSWRRPRPELGCRAKTENKCDEDVWGSGGVAPPFLTSTLVEWSASRPCCFTLGKGDAGSHWIGNWVGPKVCLDGAE
jgi:hypothetical protein